MFLVICHELSESKVTLLAFPQQFYACHPELVPLVPPVKQFLVLFFNKNDSELQNGR